MKILLFSCPDATHPLFPRFSKSPQLGLSSLSAMVRDIADVAIGDLVLRRRNVPKGIRQAMEAVKPQIVGISAMTFQYETARRIAALVKQINPEATIILGGYHASLAGESLAHEDTALFDFLVRGEGEQTFRELVVALSEKKPYQAILGLSYAEDGRFHHNPKRPIIQNLHDIPLPDRNHRLWTGYHIHGRKFDHIESSRGCTLPCTFCSITQHYGKNYRTSDFNRVVEDVLVCQRQGTEELFFVDDNITLNPRRFEGLLDSLIEAKIPNMYFSTQGSILGLYDRPQVIEKMARANFDLVFLGIENMSSRNLKYYKKGDIAEKTEWVLKKMRECRIMVMGGFILGSPDDTKEDILDQFRFMRDRSIDSLLVQILTPYPGTPLTRELEEKGYVVNKDFKRYNGFFANVRTDHLSSRDLDFLKWKHLPYYRDLKWLVRSSAMRMYPIRLMAREGMMRFGEWVVEKTRLFFFGEEYAFLKYYERQLNSNCFFGELIVPSWSDHNPEETESLALLPYSPVSQ